MGRQILLVSLVLIVAGLALFVVSDPVFRTISSGSGFTPGGSGTFAGSTIFQECRTVTNESVEQCLTQNGITGFGGSGNFTGVRSSTFAFNTGAVTEGVGGIGLIAIGSILVLVQLFKMPAASASGKKWRKYRQ